MLIQRKINSIFFVTLFSILITSVYAKENLSDWYSKDDWYVQCHNTKIRQLVVVGGGIVVNGNLYLTSDSSEDSKKMHYVRIKNGHVYKVTRTELSYKVNGKYAYKYVFSEYGSSDIIIMDECYEIEN